VYRLYSTAAAAILKFHTIHPDKKLGRYTYLWRVILRISEFLKKVGNLYDGENMRSSSRSETVMSHEIAKQ